MKTVFRNLMAASLAGRHVRGNQLAHSATYDRRAPMAAPHWIQCATDTTRPGAMVRAAAVPGGWPAPLAWAGEAHDGSYEGTPPRGPASPARQPVQPPGSGAAPWDVRRGRSGDARQVRARRHTRPTRRRRARGLPAASTANPSSVPQAHQAVAPLIHARAWRQAMVVPPRSVLPVCALRRHEPARPVLREAAART